MKQNATPEAATMKSIMVYGSDKDLCASLQMLYQDRFHILTVPPHASLAAAVESEHPDVLIADVPPTESIAAVFEHFRVRYPQMRILLFYTPRYSDLSIQEGIHRYVDAVLYQPVDLDVVTRRVEEYLSTSVAREGKHRMEPRHTSFHGTQHH